MASASIRKQCAHEQGCKQAAVTNCEGCSKAFCFKHMIDHRRSLDEEMNIIIDEHDHLKNTLNRQTTKPDSHPFIKEIYNWEKESIGRIQRRAKELRQEFLQLITVHGSELSKKLQQLSEKLRESRENDDFIETELQCWRKTLCNLRTDLTSLSTIFINRCDNVSLIQNISIDSFMTTKELFTQVSDNRVRIEDSGRVVVHDITIDSTEVRGKNEYGSERHEIRLRIEELMGYWIFFGINSKSTPLRNESHRSESAYGWSSNNYIWLKGSGERNNLKPDIEMRTNDVIALIFDCDSRKISIINERTEAKHELVVNIDSCPFPWQLQVNLLEPNSRVRIL